MYLSAIGYVVLIMALMLFGFWQDRLHGGGNHWVYFGTPLDRLIQIVGIGGIIALSGPPALVAVAALLRGHILWCAVLALATLSLAVLAFSFATMALD